MVKYRRNNSREEENNYKGGGEVAKIEEKFIVNLKGKQYRRTKVHFTHQNKLKSIKTELIQIPTKKNNNQCIISY